MAGPARSASRASGKGLVIEPWDDRTAAIHQTWLRPVPKYFFNGSYDCEGRFTSIWGDKVATQRARDIKAAIDADAEVVASLETDILVKGPEKRRPDRCAKAKARAPRRRRKRSGWRSTRVSRGAPAARADLAHREGWRRQHASATFWSVFGGGSCAWEGLVAVSGQRQGRNVNGKGGSRICCFGPFGDGPGLVAIRLLLRHRRSPSVCCATCHLPSGPDYHRLPKRIRRLALERAYSGKLVSASRHVALFLVGRIIPRNTPGLLPPLVGARAPILGRLADCL